MGSVDEFHRQAFELHRAGQLAEAHINLSSLLQEMGRLDAAVALLQSTARLPHNLTRAHFNRGNALRLAGRCAAAAASYRQAIALAPEFRWMRGCFSYRSAATRFLVYLHRLGLRTC